MITGLPRAGSDPTESPRAAHSGTHNADRTPKSYELLDGNRRPYRSAAPGRLGGHRRGRRYGRLDCPAALRALARGGYLRDRVFFADESAALAAGFRPCAVCLPREYRSWCRPATTRRQLGSQR